MSLQLAKVNQCLQKQGPGRHHGQGLSELEGTANTCKYPCLRPSPLGLHKVLIQPSSIPGPLYRDACICGLSALCPAPSEYKEENGLQQWLGQDPVRCIMSLRPQDEAFLTLSSRGLVFSNTAGLFCSFLFP